MYIPESSQVFSVKPVHSQVEQSDWKHSSPNVVPEDSVGVEERPVLVEERQNDSSPGCLEQSETRSQAMYIEMAEMMRPFFVALALSSW